WVTRSAPSTLDWYMASQSAGSASATGSNPIAPPALLTSTVIPAGSAAALAASAATDSGSVTSSAIGSMPSVPAASSTNRSTRRAAAQTAKPSAASRRAVAAPIPLEAPVTTAIPREPAMCRFCRSRKLRHDRGCPGVVLAGPARAAPASNSRTTDCSGGYVRQGRITRHGVLPHRVATISVHTSPLEQPGGGDAGGMNVYVLET